MDINSISSGAVSSAHQQKVGDAVGITVLSKALDIQSNTAKQLVESIPEQPKPASEAHLGNQINLHA